MTAKQKLNLIDLESGHPVYLKCTCQGGVMSLIDATTLSAEYRCKSCGNYNFVDWALLPKTIKSVHP